MGVKRTWAGHYQSHRYSTSINYPYSEPGVIVTVVVWDPYSNDNNRSVEIPLRETDLRYMLDTIKERGQ